MPSFVDATVMVTVSIAAATAAADPIRVRFPEGPAHGFVELTDQDGKRVADGELQQWREKNEIVSRLTFYFTDGSLYDETVRFSQHKVFRLLSYQLEQHGPSFKAQSDIKFDGSGHYRVRQRAAPDKDAEEKSGTIEVPDDLSNGMTSIYLKNLPSGQSATVHLLACTPGAVVLDVHLTPEGTAQYSVGRASHTATRFLIDPKVPGVKGVVATLIGKQPPPFRMWIADDKAPVLIRFEGPLEAEGATWRLGVSGPRLEGATRRE